MIYLGWNPNKSHQTTVKIQVLSFCNLFDYPYKWLLQKKKKAWGHNKTLSACHEINEPAFLVARTIGNHTDLILLIVYSEFTTSSQGHTELNYCGSLLICKVYIWMREWLCLKPEKRTSTMTADLSVKGSFGWLKIYTATTKTTEGGKTMSAFACNWEKMAT